ncbi:MAG: DegT/DnrJ/EryC1/StrS family aminotransferase [Firmicutes bacterium]|nr:DegT/DnrJ/EryC1/StrS family aminotransferase [Bacillota bacterium]
MIKLYRIGREEVEAVARVINGKKLFRVGSPYQEVDKFEREWAQHLGVKYALCVNGGTTALIAGLAGMRIGPGDEVIIPSYTFMATAIAVLAVGAIPVLAEIDGTMTIDPEDLERKLTPETKAVIPVHMCGFPANMEAIMELSRKYGFKVIEDACQADGGSFRGKHTGTWGHAGVFSFNDFKIMAAGEGGALVTNDYDIYERALIYHDGGAAFRPYAGELKAPVFVGSQFRASEITGAILRVQLKRLPGILEDLRAIKKEFVAHFKDQMIPSNDLAGDCGTTVGFSFANEEEARNFAASPGVGGRLPIDSGKHVYINWEPILQRRGAHHEALNPYRFAENQGLRMNYSKDMCPRTLEILRSTVYIGINPDWTEEEIKTRIESCQRALDT